MLQCIPGGLTFPALKFWMLIKFDFSSKTDILVVKLPFATANLKIEALGMCRRFARVLVYCNLPCEKKDGGCTIYHITAVIPMLKALLLSSLNDLQSFFVFLYALAEFSCARHYRLMYQSSSFSLPWIDKDLVSSKTQCSSSTIFAVFFISSQLSLYALHIVLPFTFSKEILQY